MVNDPFIFRYLVVLFGERTKILVLIYNNKMTVFGREEIDGRINLMRVKFDA